MPSDKSKEANENEANVPDWVLEDSAKSLREARAEKAKQKAAEKAKAKASDEEFLSGIENEYSKLADIADRTSGSYPLDFLSRRSKLDNAIDRETVVNASDNGYKKLSPVERQKLQKEGKLAEADRREAARAKLIRSAALKGVQFDEQGRVKMKKGGKVKRSAPMKAKKSTPMSTSRSAPMRNNRGDGIAIRGKTKGTFR